MTNLYRCGGGGSSYRKPSKVQQFTISTSDSTSGTRVFTFSNASVDKCLFGYGLTINNHYFSVNGFSAVQDGSDVKISVTFSANPSGSAKFVLTAMEFEDAKSSTISFLCSTSWNRNNNIQNNENKISMVSVLTSDSQPLQGNFGLIGYNSTTNTYTHAVEYYTSRSTISALISSVSF